MATIALLVLAAGLTGLGVAARVDASDRRSSAEPVARRLRTQVETHRRSTAELVTLRHRADELTRSLDALLEAVREQVDSANHAVSITNHAAELYNSGDSAGAATALGADGGNVANDLDAKTKAVRDAAGRVQRDAVAMEKASND